MLIWCDIESSGLDPLTDSILEVGVIVTTDDLVERLRWSQPARWLGDRGKLNPVVRELHERSGLLAECAGAEMSLHEIESMIIGAIKGVGVVSGDPPPLAGSSVYFEREFLRRQMPDLLGLCSYRNVDVSTLTEVCRRWHPTAHASRPGADLTHEKKPHRSIPDLEYSIALLRYYRKEIFVRPVFQDPTAPKLTDLASRCQKPTKTLSHYGNPVLCTMERGHKGACL